MSTGMRDTAPHDTPPPFKAAHSGRWVVLVMFVFAGAIIGTLWIYSDRHTAPFRELTRALAAEFPGSVPKVEGGQRKKHKDTPRILRIILKVTFDPERDDRGAADFAGRVLAFARGHHDMAKYDTVEIHLFQLRPEEEIRQRAFSFPVESLPADAAASPREAPARSGAAAAEPR